MIEYIAPAVSLIVFGAGQDAVPLVRFAKALGWQVTVVDDRQAHATVKRFPDADAIRLVQYDQLDRDAPPIDTSTAVVIMTHHFLHDVHLMQYVLPSKARYVGVLGPRQRTENLLSSLRSTSVLSSG